MQRKLKKKKIKRREKKVHRKLRKELQREKKQVLIEMQQTRANTLNTHKILYTAAKYDPNHNISFFYFLKMKITQINVIVRAQ